MDLKKYNLKLQDLICNETGEVFSNNYFAKKNRFYPSVAISDPKKISYLKEREPDYLQFDPEYRKDHGVMVKAGKFFRHCLPNVSDSIIQKLVSKWYAIISDLTNDSWEFELSDDICHYYHEDQYFDDSGSLGSSCMQYGSLQDCIEFYDNYNAKILILKNTDDKIKGRAIVWENVFFPELDKTMNFMDRVYVNDDNDKELFVDYAWKNGWVWKDKQSMVDKTSFRFQDNEIENAILFRDFIKIKPTSYFDIVGCRVPYMDTLTYANEDGVLSNNEEFGQYTLEDTDGNAIGIYCCGRCRCNLPNDSHFFNDNGECFCEDCFHENYFYCEDCGEIHHRDHGTHIGGDGMVCDTCRDNNYSFCGDCEECFHNDDDLHETVDGDMICDYCAENYWEKCPECERYEKKRYMTEIEDTWYCGECAVAIIEETEKETENE